MVLGGATAAAAAALQEAPFACFEDDEIDAAVLSGPYHQQIQHQQHANANANANGRGLPTHAVVMPGGTKALPARSVAKCSYSFLSA
jgi:hypothetical protein